MSRNGVLDCLPTTPVNFVRGENCTLWDDQGSRYVDLESGSWSTVLGHGHPRMNRAMKEQIDRITHLNVRYPNHLVEEAAQRILRLSALEGGKCLFLSSGSEAVEFGAQALRKITGRPLLLTLAKSYLGALGSVGHKSPGEWHLLDWEKEELLDAVPFNQIGGFLFEPGGGSPDFVRFPTVPLIKEIVRRVRASGGFIMANEVTTGMGRTGAWFGFQHYGVHPDILALGKGLGNGYPVSAAVFSLETALNLETSGIRYAQSHQNNPLGCAVALEVMAELEEGAWIERGKTLGEAMLSRFNALPDPHGRIKEVRGRGMLAAIEFTKEGGLTGERAQRFLWEHGLITASYPAGHLAGTGLRFEPALTIRCEDLTCLRECLEELLAMPG